MCGSGIWIGLFFSVDWFWKLYLSLHTSLILKKSFFQQTDRGTDGQMDRRTDGRNDRQTWFKNCLEFYSCSWIKDAFQKKVNFVTSVQRGEGVLVKILINAKLGRLIERKGVSKVNVPKFDVILSVFSPSIFEVLATKTFNSTVFTDRTKYCRDCCSHNLLY